MSKKWGKYFGHFPVFFQLQAVFLPFFGTIVKTAKHKKVAPGISLKILIDWA